MKAITFAGLRQVRYETVADPRIEAAGDAIVRVTAAGICGSDMHPYHEREEGLDPGTVMGHEFVGEIVELGSDPTGLAVGDVVFSPFTTSCGDCFYCRSGLTCRCISGRLFGWVHEGVGLHGAQAEYVRVPLAGGTLMAVPEGIGPEEALLLGDILSTGFFCAEQAGIGTLARDGSVLPAAGAPPGRGSRGTYVVVGCGPVGLMTVIAARALGAEEVFAVDRVAERLALAAACGAVALSFEEDPVVDVVREVTDGRGADAVMEVVGSRAATELSIDLLRPGGVLSSVGVHTEDRFGFTPVTAYDKNLTFKSGRCPARDYMERLVPLLQSGGLASDPTRVFSHHLPLAAGVGAYEMFDKKTDGCTKVLLEPRPGA